MQTMVMQKWQDGKAGLGLWEGVGAVGARWVWFGENRLREESRGVSVGFRRNRNTTEEKAEGGVVATGLEPVTSTMSRKRSSITCLRLLTL